jgi:hypothetical protein
VNRLRTLLAAILVLACASRAALADPTALLVNGTVVKPVGAEGRVSQSSGAGGDILLLPTSSWLVQIGGYGVFGKPATGVEARDIFDLHLQVGMTPAGRSASVSPYACVGIDVLSITTRDHDKGETERGTTLGVSAQVGVLGRIGDRGLVKASGSYLGAIVPGTGDDLGGLVLQLAAGLAFD